MRPHLFKRTLTLEIDLPSYLVQKKKQTPEKRKRLPELPLQCFHSDPIFPPDGRPGLRSLIKMLFIGLFSLGGEHWFLMLGLSQCQQSKPLLLGQQNIRSVLELEEGPMCPHTHPHKPPGGRSPLQTQQLAGKLLKIMPPGRACIPRSLGGVFFF